MSGVRRAAPGDALTLNRVTDPVRANDVNDNLLQIENADRNNLKRGREAYMPSLLLAGPDGATYRVTIDLSLGAPVLSVKQVAR